MQWQHKCLRRNKEVVFYMGQGSIIGYEINEKTCQISFYNEQEMEPDTWRWIPIITRFLLS